MGRWSGRGSLVISRVTKKPHSVVPQLCQCLLHRTERSDIQNPGFIKQGFYLSPSIIFFTLQQLPLMNLWRSLSNSETVNIWFSHDLGDGWDLFASTFSFHAIMSNSVLLGHNSGIIFHFHEEWLSRSRRVLIGSSPVQNLRAQAYKHGQIVRLHIIKYNWAKSINELFSVSSGIGVVDIKQWYKRWTLIRTLRINLEKQVALLDSTRCFPFSFYRWRFESLTCLVFKLARDLPEQIKDLQLYPIPMSLHGRNELRKKNRCHCGCNRMLHRQVITTNDMAEEDLRTICQYVNKREDCFDSILL